MNADRQVLEGSPGILDVRRGNSQQCSPIRDSFKLFISIHTQSDIKPV
jgi:hypothetical protein